MTARLNVPKLEQVKAALKRCERFSLKIGIADDAYYPPSDDAEKTVMKVADVANILENGWVQIVTPKQAGYLRRHGFAVKPDTVISSPPRPFMRLTFENRRDVWNRLAEQFLLSRFDFNKVEQSIISAMTYVGDNAVSDVKETIYENLYGIEPRSSATLNIMRRWLRDRELEASGDAGMVRSKSLFRSGLLMTSVAYQILGL